LPRAYLPLKTGAIEYPHQIRFANGVRFVFQDAFPTSKMEAREEVFSGSNCGISVDGTSRSHASGMLIQILQRYNWQTCALPCRSLRQSVRFFPCACANCEIPAISACLLQRGFRNLEGRHGPVCAALMECPPKTFTPSLMGSSVCWRRMMREP
jgi:hypothetical protein